MSVTRHWLTWQHIDNLTWHHIGLVGNTNTKHLHASLFFKKKSEATLVKTIYIYETGQHAKKSDILSQFLQQSMTFLGETSSQTIVNSSLGFIFPNGSIIHNNSGVYFQTSTPVLIRVPNTCDFATLKTRILNTL